MFDLSASFIMYIPSRLKRSWQGCVECKPLRIPVLSAGQQGTAGWWLSASPLASQGSGGENLPEGKCPISHLPVCLQSPSTDANISNPCYPHGYSTTFTMGHVFGSLCTEKQRPKSYNPSDTITFTGTGDPQLCREKVASVFDFSACQEQDACSFDGIYQPKVQGPFVVRVKSQDPLAGGGYRWGSALPGVPLSHPVPILYPASRYSLPR